MNIIKNIFEMSIYASIMIAVVMAIRLLMHGRINLKIVAFLWALVLLRLIIPVTIPSPIHVNSFIKSEKAESEEISDTEQTYNNEAIEPVVYNSTSVVYEETTYINENNYDTTPIAPVEQTQTEKISDFINKFSVWEYMIFVWAMGVIFLIIKNMVTYIMFNSHVKYSKAVNSNKLNNEIRRLKKILDLKSNVKVIVSKYVDSPLTFRLIKPIIVLPAQFTNMISSEKLSMILLHELCHIKRKDIFYNILWLIAKIIHWFNPLVWIAYNKYIEDIELACDEMVTQYLDEEQSYIYSQSLIDVIRFTRSMAKLPIALSFCEDKCKLRKRVENMLKPKQKLKSASFVTILVAIIMIITCFTTSCQSSSVILSERDNNTSETTVTDETAEVAEGAVEENIAQLDNTISETDSYQPVLVSNSATSPDGTIHVNVDAEVINNQPENISVAELTPKTFTADEVEQMALAFFGNNVLFDRTYTKSDYDFIIQNRLEGMEDAEYVQIYADDRDITDMEEAKEMMQKAVDRWYTEQEKAPAERPIISNDFSGINDENGLYALIDTELGYTGSISAGTKTITFTAFNDDNIYYTSRDSTFDVESWIDPDTDDAEFQSAKSMAEQMISDMGINDVQLGDIYLKKDDTHKFSVYPQEYNGREYYVFCFERIIGNSSLDNTLCSGNLSYYKDPVDTGVEYTGPSDEGMRPYETLELWIEGDTFVQFIYRYPMQVSQILDDNATINIDYNQAIELANEYAYYWYDYIYTGFDEININVDEIELILARTKDKDTGEFIVVPAWNFSGQLEGKLNEDGAYNRDEEPGDWDIRNGNWGTNRTLITVNAIDGSIIDMEHGF